MPIPDAIAHSPTAVAVRDGDGRVFLYAIEGDFLEEIGELPAKTGERYGIALGIDENLVAVSVRKGSGVLEAIRVFSFTRLPFLQESEIEAEIIRACGPEGGDAISRLRCVESTLHALWEQRCILYSSYDRVLKKAWEDARSEAASLLQMNPTLTSDLEKTLTRLDKFLELEKLERKVTIRRQQAEKIFSEIVAIRMKQVGEAVSGDGSYSFAAGQKAINELRAKGLAVVTEVERRVPLVADLLKANPDLPPSPAIEAQTDLRQLYQSMK